MATQFEGQREDEVVLEVFRRHPIAMRKGFYMLLIPLAIGAVPPLLWPDNLQLFLLPLGALGLGLILFFYQWISWYFTVFILTNQRLRQVTQNGMFGKSVIDLGISKILNISYNIPGLAGEMFGFGTIVIQTYVGDLVLDRIHHPEKVYNILQDVVADTTYKRDENEAIEAVD